jgi:hypothetical protein
MIDTLTNATFLLAARLDRPRANFDREWIFLAGLAVVLALVLLLSHWSSRRRQREFWCDSPKGVFHELCRAHRLDRANRRLLQRLGTAREVENLAEFFVEPEKLDATDLPPAMKPAVTELRQLRHRLFE